MNFAQDPNECFDIVDENDHVIGQGTRSEIHAKKYFHRAVHIWIMNKDSNKVFLQKRSMNKDTSPGRWDSSCSGHVDSGEDYITAAKRELAEEIGILTPIHLNKVWEMRPSAANGYEFIHVYTGEYEGIFHLNPSEIDEGKWIEFSQLTHEIRSFPEKFSPVFVQIARQMIDF